MRPISAVIEVPARPANSRADDRTQLPYQGKRHQNAQRLLEP